MYSCIHLKVKATSRIGSWLTEWRIFGFLARQTSREFAQYVRQYEQNRRTSCWIIYLSPGFVVVVSGGEEAGQPCISEF